MVNGNMKVAAIFIILLFITAFFAPAIVSVVNSIVVPAVKGVYKLIASGGAQIGVLGDEGDPIEGPHPT